MINIMNNEKSIKRRGLFSPIFGLIKYLIIALTVGLIAAGGFLIGGFLKFTDTVTGYEFAESPAKASAIVVFTGGKLRIDEAVKLLVNGNGKRLLISGVYPDTSQNTLKSKFHIDQTWFDCCVDVDKKATNTLGNAMETRKWSIAHNFDSLIIVTSNYHMPRSILETRRLLPGIKLTPHPVATADFKSKIWYKDRASLNLLISEYSKYVATQIRPVLSEGAVKSIRASVASF